MILLTVILDSPSKEVVQMVWGCKILYIYKNIYMYVYIYAYGIDVCIYICMYVCMYGIYDMYTLFHPKILKVKG